MLNHFLKLWHFLPDIITWHEGDTGNELLTWEHFHLNRYHHGHLGPKGRPFYNSTSQHRESFAQFRLASWGTRLMNVNSFFVWTYSNIFTNYCIAIQSTAIPDKSYFPAKNTDKTQLFTVLFNESQLSRLSHAFS